MGKERTTEAAASRMPIFGRAESGSVRDYTVVAASTSLPVNAEVEARVLKAIGVLGDSGVMDAPSDSQ